MEAMESAESGKGERIKVRGSIPTVFLSSPLETGILETATPRYQRATLQSTWQLFDVRAVGPSLTAKSPLHRGRGEPCATVPCVRLAVEVCSLFTALI